MSLILHVHVHVHVSLSLIRSQLLSLLKVMNNMSWNQRGQLKPFVLHILIHKLKVNCL